jgi:hypothetical protein
MNFCNSRISVNDDPEVDGGVIVTFYPDNVPTHFSISFFDLKKLLEQSNLAIKLEDNKHLLTGNNHGN